MSDDKKDKEPNTDGELVRLEPEKVATRFSESENLITLITNQDLQGVGAEDAWKDEAPLDLVKQRKLIFLSGLVLFVFIGAVLVSYNIFKDSKNGSENDNELAGLLQKEDEYQGETKLKYIKNDKIKMLLNHFYSAKHHEELLKYCVDDGMLKSRLNEYYVTRKMNLARRKPVNHHMIHTQVFEGKSNWLCKVFFDDGGMRMINIKETELGLKVDWEFSVCWQSIEWSDLLSEKNWGGVYEQRVQIYENTAYLADYPEADFLTVRIKAPGLDYDIYAYIKRSKKISDFFNGVIKGWRESKKTSPAVIVKLRPISLSNKILICEVEDLVSKSWYK